MIPPWLKIASEQIILHLKVKPGSKQNSFYLDKEGGLYLRVQADAQEGKANKMLIQYLAKFLRLPQKQIAILHGVKSSKKVIAIQFLPAQKDEMIEKFLALKSSTTASK